MNKNRHMSEKIDIILLYLRDYKISYSGREIARLIKKSPQTALVVLNQLVSENILIFKQQGKNHLYNLNNKNLVSKMYLYLAELSKSQEFLNKPNLYYLIDNIINHAESIVIFGSYAKNLEKKGSDIDVVVINGDKEEIEKIKKIFPFEVNIEYVNWKLFEKSFKEKNHLALEIKKDHLIYGNIFKLVNIYCEE